MVQERGEEMVSVKWVPLVSQYKGDDECGRNEIYRMMSEEEMSIYERISMIKIKYSF